jgi:lipopolysaccharide/colanic/teichoic acid biosynthesis glycosyltransferase
MMIYHQPIPAFGLAVKRFVDVVISALGIIVTAPILAAAAIWIHFDSPGPIFYPAVRVGKKGRRFRCYKLRTMVVGADAKKARLRKKNERKGPFFKMTNDPRVTRSGRWLRKYSIDEIPQLINVFRGDMSLVGPRPHPEDDVELYKFEYLRRLEVKPGITGLWQVTARSDPSFQTNMDLDLDYIEHWSLALDLRILLKTLPELVRASGS